MSGGVRLEGMRELRDFLTNAPKEIRDHGMPIVRDETEQAAKDYIAGLPRKSGRLQRLVKVLYPAESSVLLGIVSSGAPHSHIVDKGTGPRLTSSGANRGRMPALPTANQMGHIAPIRRARMLRRLVDMLRSMGFEASDV